MDQREDIDKIFRGGKESRPSSSSSITPSAKRERNEIAFRRLLEKSSSSFPGIENGALYFLTATRELPSLSTKGGFAIDSRGGCSLGKFPRTGESLGESSRLFQYYSSRSELFSRSPNATSVGSSIFFLIRIIFPFFFWKNLEFVASVCIITI